MTSPPDMLDEDTFNQKNKLYQTNSCLSSDARMELPRRYKIVNLGLLYVSIFWQTMWVNKEEKWIPE